MQFNRRGITRFVSVLTGAVVLFGLEQGFAVQFYIAVPAAILTYIASLIGVGLMLGTDPAE
jgi:uncharacterized membrane protein